MMYSLLVASLLAGASVAAPVTQGPIPTEEADIISFVARVTKQRTSGRPLAIDNYVFASAHVNAGIDQALLVSNGSSSSSGGNPFNLTAEQFVQNGTTDEIMYGSGYVERFPPSASAGVYGVVLRGNYTDGVVNGTHAAGVDVGGGSKGVGVRFPYTGVVFPEDQPVLGYQNTTDEATVTYGSQFFACEASLYNEPAVELFWRDQDAVTPADCTEVVLFAQCVGNVTDASAAASYHTIHKSPCYPDAASVPYVGNQ